MIKNIFIPEKIGSFYIFTERIVGIEITATEVLAVLIVAHGTRRRIEQLIKEPINQDPVTEQQERISTALKTVFEKLGSYTQLIACIPSEEVIFKEISVPLMSEQKIKLIVPFEIESLLPFALEQAAIDSIIVNKDETNRKADVFVAAIKQDSLQKYLAPFVAINKLPDRITTDVFELYGLYHAIPEYQNNTQTTLLVAIDDTTTQLILLMNNQIKSVRVIHKGLADIHTENNLIHLENQNTQTALNKLLDEVNLTVENFFTKLQTTQKIEKIVLCGKATEIKGLQEHIASYMHVPCELLTLNRILHNNTVTSKLALSNEFVIPLAAAFSSESTELVNLNRQAAEETTNSLLDKQLIAAGVLIALLFIMLLTNSIITKRSLQKEIEASESEAITLLTKKLNLTLPRGKRTLEQVNTLARNEIAKKANIWFALSSSNRFSFLAYLQDISTRINRESLGLDLRQLTIAKDTDTMTLEGQVKNFEALRTLEEDLNQSKLFTSVSKPQDLKFNISIALAKLGEEEL